MPSNDDAQLEDTNVVPVYHWVMILGLFAYPAIYVFLLATGRAGLLEHSFAAVVMWVFVAFNALSTKNRLTSPEGGR